MSGVIKHANGASAVGPLPSLRRVASPPLPDPRITALEERVRQLEQQLEEDRVEAKRAIAAAHLAGRDAAQADDERRTDLLAEAVDGALVEWREQLAKLDGLAAALSATAISKMFGEASADLAAMVGRTLRHHLDRLGRETVVEVRVSGADFPDDAAVAALAAAVAPGQARIVATSDLPAGACRLSLLLGQVELDPAMQWATLERALHSLERTS
jgi:type III secretion protein L